MHNAAVLKALFKVSDNELDFTCAVAIAVETEDTAKVAKETIYGNKPKPVNKVTQQVKPHTIPQKTDKNTGSCYRCGKPNHKANQCHFKDTQPVCILFSMACSQPPSWLSMSPK